MATDRKYAVLCTGSKVTHHPGTGAPKNVLHKVICTLASPLVYAASDNGVTAGIGVGGSGGIGALFGTALGGSLQLVADRNHNLGLAATFSFNGGFGVLGIGGLFGGQLSLSNARTIYDLEGPAINGGVSGGAGPAVGFDVSKSGGTYTGTLTVGPGIGGKGAALSKAHTAVIGTSCTRNNMYP